MEEELLTQIPGLSFNARRRQRDPYSYEFLTRPFDFGDNHRLSTFKPNDNSTFKPEGAGKGSSPLGPMLGTMGGVADRFIGPGQGNATGMERSSKYSSFMEKHQKSNQIRGGVENALISSGNPYGMAAGAIMKGARALDNKVFRNDDGLYKSQGAKWASSLLSPSMMISNIATGEMFNQKALRKELTTVKTGANMDEMVKNEEVGRQINSMIPHYQAPAYGRRGMKIRTKFSGY